MNSALLKYPIQIYRLETKANEYGTIDAEYAFLRNTRAHMIFESQTQTTSNGEIYYPTTRTFVVRSYIDVVEQDRIKWDNKWWDIISINKNDYYGDIEIRTQMVNQ